MIQENTTWNKTELPGFVRDTLTEDMLLVDIETTGLSPARDTIYCIGCGYLKGEDVCVLLFFAERPDEEAEVLRAFLSLTASHARLVTFNGATFDLPFVEKRAALLCGKAALPPEHIDLYREAKAQRRLLQLSSYRQKTLECFLGCAREDTQSGADLIDLYLHYTETQDKDALRALLLHNRDDVRGMFDLLALLAYRQFAEGEFTITDVREDTASPTRFFEVTLVPHHPLPQSIHRTEEGLSLLLDRERSLLRLPIRHGTLKHFFTNYREYYYLPAEDTAVHESVGAFVDAAHRKRATKQTCYVKKECDYVSLPIRTERAAADNAGTLPAAGPGVLRRDYADSRMYLELPAASEALQELITAWFAQLM